MKNYLKFLFIIATTGLLCMTSCQTDSSNQISNKVTANSKLKTLLGVQSHTIPVLSVFKLPILKLGKASLILFVFVLYKKSCLYPCNSFVVKIRKLLYAAIDPK